MSTRIINCNVEAGGYTTEDSNGWVDYEPYSNAGSFGQDIPQTIKVTFTNAYPNYASSVTVDFSIKIKLSNNNWYSIYSNSVVGNRNSSGCFDTPQITLNSSLVSLLQSNSITHLGIFQDGTRQIKGDASSTATIQIDYSEYVPPAPSVTITQPKNFTATQNGMNVDFSWSASSVTGSDGIITYRVCDRSHNVIATTTSTSVSVPLSSFGYEAKYLYVNAECGEVSSSSDVILFEPKKPVASEHSTIRYYDGSSWKQAIIYYYNGTNWVECTPYYYNGSKWQQCSY